MIRRVTASPVDVVAFGLIVIGTPLPAAASWLRHPGDSHRLPAISYSEAAPVAHADVVITPASHQQVTTVKVGQIIKVTDAPDLEWGVSYRPEVLLALTPPEKMSNPGSAGWVFRVIAPGNTEIVLESIAPPCPGPTPCPPNVVRLVFPIEAVP
jgi:hypothetical protein